MDTQSNTNTPISVTPRISKTLLANTRRRSSNVNPLGEFKYLSLGQTQKEILKLSDDPAVRKSLSPYRLKPRQRLRDILQKVRVLIRVALIFEKSITETGKKIDTRRKSFTEILTRLGSRENSSSSLLSLPVFNKSYYKKTERNNEKNLNLEKLLNIPTVHRYQPEIHKITAILDLKFQEYNGPWANFSKSLKHRLCKVASYQYTPNKIGVKNQLKNYISQSPFTSICRSRVIVRFGHVPYNIYILVSGRLRINTTPDNGQTWNTAAMLNPSSIVGEISCYSKTLTGKRNADVIAETNCELLVLDKSQFENILLPFMEVQVRETIKFCLRHPLFLGSSITYEEIERAISKNDGQLQFYNEVRFNEIDLKPDSILIVLSGTVHIIAQITKHYVNPVSALQRRKTVFNLTKSRPHTVHSGQSKEKQTELLKYRIKSAPKMLKTNKTSLPGDHQDFPKTVTIAKLSKGMVYGLKDANGTLVNSLYDGDLNDIKLVSMGADVIIISNKFYQKNIQRAEMQSQDFRYKDRTLRMKRWNVRKNPLYKFFEGRIAENQKCTYGRARSAVMVKNAWEEYKKSVISDTLADIKARKAKRMYV